MGADRVAVLRPILDTRCQPLSALCAWVVDMVAGIYAPRAHQAAPHGAKPRGRGLQELRVCR